MICRHIKVNEIYNIILDTEENNDIRLEYGKITETGDVSFSILTNSVTRVDKELFIKQISFSSAGEYLVRVTTSSETVYERFKVYNFSEEDSEMKLDNMLLTIENMRSEFNEDLLFIKKQLRIINAQL